MPYKKQILKEKRKQEIERQKMTYSGITINQSSSSNQVMPQRHHVPQITKEEILKINICVSHAHYANLSNPGTYSYELNKALTANNLPNIIIPDSPNPNMNQDEQLSHSQPQAQAVQPKTQPRSTISSMGKQNVKNDNEAGKNQQIKEKDIIESTKIGLHIYTTKEQGWPKEEFTVDTLVHNMRNNKYKYTYEDDSLDDEELFNLMLTNKITYKEECWQKIDKDAFRKLRSGLKKERSPIGNRDRRLHKPSNGQ